jgi:hypothetical protein
MKRAAILLAGFAVTAAGAADDWDVTIAPYAMGSSLDGTAALKGQQADFDISASDIFDHMDFGFMSAVVARKGKWGIAGDALWVDLSVENPMAKVDPALGIVTLGGLRRMTDWADVTFGARWNHLDLGIEVLQGPMAGLKVDGARDWVDPTVGILLRTPKGHRFHAGLAADVGGFGVGSDLSWSVMPTVGVAIGERGSFEVGWRSIDVDYETGEGASRFLWDVRIEGPVAGFTYTF